MQSHDRIATSVLNIIFLLHTNMGSNGMFEGICLCGGHQIVNAALVISSNQIVKSLSKLIEDCKSWSEYK